MIPVIAQFLMAKFESLSYIDKVFGMAFFTTRNEEKVVGVKEAGELQHINYDQYKSLVYILNNGTVSRTTVEHPDIASLELVTETYPLSVVIYSQGLENVNCESASQSIAQGIKKALSGKQPDLIDAINADNVTIRITATDLDKDAVWKSQTSLPNALTEKDILIAVDFEVTITGDEQCFAGEPCEAPEFVFDYAAEPLCTKVNECLGISASGSTTKFLNERGQFVDNTDAVSSVNSAIGAVTITVTGTANRISVTGGSGLAPTVDISASYVGQTSITTLGTVTTGTLSTGAIIGGVTMTLGSDAANDIYYRNGSGVLTRLANGTTGQYLGATTGSAPSWSTPSSTITWNSISNPTGTQSLTFDDGELNDWTINSDTETFHTWTHNSLTTGTTQLLTTSSITTGKLLSLVSTSTAANNFSLLNIASSGANANSSRTATGANISVTNTGTTSTNIGLKVVASGATNNYAALFDGRVGIGTTTPAYPLHISIPTITSRGVQIDANLSGGGATVWGQYINATGTVPNATGNRYGIYSDLYNNLSYTSSSLTRNTVAVAGVVRGSSSGTSAYGGYFIANGDGGSGTTYGIYSETTNTGSVSSYAGYFKNSNAYTYNRYGVYSYVDGGGGSASTTYGVYSSANTSNNGTAYGVYGTTNNNSQTGANYYGGMFTTAGAAANSYGVRASATGAATNNYGGYFTATGASNNYGLIVSDGLAGISVTAPTALLHVAASTTAAASLRIAASTNSPSSPNDGDVWYLDTNDRLMFRKASNSVEILSASTATTEIVVPDTTLTITYNGTTYKLLAKA